MHVQMIRYGVAAGLSFLVALAVMDHLTRPSRTAAAAQDDISDQVWQVLAEARRIVEESA